MVKRVISDKTISDEMKEASSRTKVAIHKRESESRASSLARALADEISLMDSDMRTQKGKKIAKAQQAICDVEKMLREIERKT